ncbi:uncharacterized protein [Glycine max]|uniref:uncharacterized protein n=1 Tax=Glycine max TaxID=3847 RepID=UPI001B355B16|nr:uncharacterized protein LOC121172978 [Glycine max]
MTLLIYFVGFIIKMSSSIIVLVYLNGIIFESDDDITFEGPKKAIQIKHGVTFDGLKNRICDKVKLDKNESISIMTCRFLVAGKYIALQICDDEDVETMIESFQQQEMGFIELCVEVDVVGASALNVKNSLLSCGNNIAANESTVQRFVTNLDEDSGDDDYMISNSYVEDSLDEEEDIDDIFDTDEEVANMIQPLTIMQPREGGSETTFWESASNYSNINWSHPDEEDIRGFDMASTFNIGQELFFGMEFESKKAVKNALQ